VKTLPREDKKHLAVLAAAWTMFFLVVDPRGQFPLNDDFQYAECARRLLAGEGFHLPNWALSWTAPHAVLGALATAPWGASNQALRLWMIFLGWLGAAGVYALARRWKAGPDAALLAALTVALSPLYAAMSASFHLDVTAAVFILAALGAFLRGREDGSPRWLACSSLLIAGSGLTRQTGFLCAAGGAAALALDRRLTVRAAAALLLPAGVLAAGFGAWVRFVHGPTWAWRSGHFVPTVPSVSVVIEHAVNFLQTGALLLLPLALSRSRDALKRRPSAGEAAVLALVGGAALIAWRAAGGLPLIQNTLHHAGLGVVTLNGADVKPSGWWSSPWLWNAAALAALGSSLVLVRAAFEESRGPRGDELRAAALFVGAPLAAMIMMTIAYDRYLLTVLPAAAAGLVAGRAETAKRASAAWAAVALAALLTAAGLSDYFAWNRARWDAGMSAVAHGVPPEKIENGFDWDGQFTLTRNLAALDARLPADKIGMWDWQTLNRIVVATTFSAEPPAAGWKLVGRFPYRTPLAGRGEVRLFADPAVLKP
jgi:4-amino-4-deoxy-L-arabinose transferase-like glycosyltransferase